MAENEVKTAPAVPPAPVSPEAVKDAQAEPKAAAYTGPTAMEVSRRAALVATLAKGHPYKHFTVFPYASGSLPTNHATNAPFLPGDVQTIEHRNPALPGSERRIVLQTWAEFAAQWGLQ